MKYADLKADNAILRQALQTVRDHYRVTGGSHNCCGTCDQIAMDGLYASADFRSAHTEAHQAEEHS